MARKRAPGAGRKSQGEFTGKSAVFSTRITPDLRHGLERAAKRSRRSLSQEVEHRLRQSLQEPKELEKRLGKPHNRALAEAVATLGRNIDYMVGPELQWIDDAFSCEALKAAIGIFLARLSPDGPIIVPKPIEQSAAFYDQHKQSGIAAQYRTPEGVGASVALGLLSLIEGITDPPPLDHPSTDKYSDIFFLAPALRKHLKLKPESEK